MLINTAFGVANVRKDWLNVARTHELSPLRTAFTVILPAAAPTILAGLDRATQGALFKDKKEVAGPALERGVVFQNYSLLADRILLMTNGPYARIAESVKVDIPRPMDRISIIHDPGDYPTRCYSGRKRAGMVNTIIRKWLNPPSGFDIGESLCLKVGEFSNTASHNLYKVLLNIFVIIY
jgi:hypothetical protein